MPNAEIYLDSYPPGVAQAARDRAVTCLRGLTAGRVAFTFAGIAIGPDDFKRAANALEKNEVLVEIDYSEYSYGEYDSVGRKINGCKISGTLYLGGGTSLLPTDEARAHLIHEAVHIALDRRGVTGITITTSESIAYIAQQMWYHRKTGSFLQDIYKSQTKLAAAAACAKAYLDYSTPNALQVGCMYASVATDSKYKKIALDMVAYDG